MLLGFSPCWCFRLNLPRMMGAMGPKDQIVRLEMTHEEAYELLLRCLQSPEHDTPVFHSAIQLLAGAIRKLDAPVKIAS